MAEKQGYGAHGTLQSSVVFYFAAVILSWVLLSCQPNLAVPLLSFQGIEQSRDDMIGGFTGTASLDTDPEGSTLVGDRSKTNIVLQNIGTEDIVITDIALYRHVYSGGEISGTEDFQTIFGFPPGLKPDLPVSIPSGGEFDGLFLYFEPVIAGYESGVLVLDTNSGQVSLRIAGYGAWELTLIVAGGANGKIVEPIEVLAGETIVYRATSTEVALKATGDHPLGLYELQQWTPGGSVSIADVNAEETVATLTGPGSVQAVYSSPYVFVLDGAAGDGLTDSTPCGSIETAIPILIANSRKGIVVAAGTYTASADISMAAGSLKGGYSSDFTARDITANLTIIDLGAYTLIFDETTGEAGFLEGFTLNGGDNAGESTTALRIYGSSPVITDNIINAGNDSLRSTAIHIINEPENDLLDDAITPDIGNNTITAGNTTAAGGTSYGIYIDWYANPAISDNVITAGSSSGSSGKSYGIYSVNQSSPVVRNNFINGGGGTAEASALYFGYGGYPEIEDNTLFNGNASNTYGLILWTFARIETLSGNNLYDCDTAFVYNYFDNTYLTTIDEVNDEYLPGETDPAVLNRSAPP